MTEGPSPEPGESPSSGRRRFSLLVNLALILASAAAAFLLLEVGTRVYLAVGDPPPRSAQAFYESRPPPYRASPYFSKTFVRFVFKHNPDVRTVAGDPDIHIPNDLHSEHLNVERGMRRTTDQPSAPVRRILLFGGSTLFGQEVGDSFTVASYLQRMVNERWPGRYAVLNLGVSAASARQQLQRLKTTDVRPGDVVVFYDGDNDMYVGPFLNNPRGTIFETFEKKAESLYLLRLVLYRLQARSAFARHFLTAKPRLPDHLRRPGAAETIARETTEIYEQAVRDAATFASTKGATFAHFLQPNLFTRSQLTAYESTLAANAYLVEPGIDRAVRVSYPLFRAMGARLRRDGIVDVDLSSLLDDRAPGQEFYLDYAHVTERANERIARAIFDGIQPVTGDR